MLLNMFFVGSKSRPQRVAGDVPPVPIRDWEAVYRLYELSEMIDAPAFLDYMFFLDGIFRDYYAKPSKPS